jgi:hypothetical protein
LSILQTSRAMPPIRARVAAALVLAATALPAQSDRQPRAVEAAIFSAFPEADAYRCIRRDVDQDARRRIEQVLPFTVHFNEIGEHCLMVALRGRRPVGLVYLRTEEGEWGLTDIAWHVALDLRVLSFQFVSGRSLHMQQLEASRFARDIAGLDLQQLRGRIVARAADDEGRQKQGLEALTTVTLRSAAKTLAVIDTVWSHEIEKLHDTATGYDLFPAAARFTRRTGSFELDDDGHLQTVGVKVVYAYDLAGILLGSVIWARAELNDEPFTLRCVTDRELRVMRAAPGERSPSVLLRTACQGLEGHHLTALQDHANPLEPLALGLGTVVYDLVNRRRRQ